MGHREAWGWKEGTPVTHPPPVEPETPARLVESAGRGPPREMISQRSAAGEPRSTGRNLRSPASREGVSPELQYSPVFPVDRLGRDARRRGGRRTAGAYWLWVKNPRHALISSPTAPPSLCGHHRVPGYGRTRSPSISLRRCVCGWSL